MKKSKAVSIALFLSLLPCILFAQSRAPQNVRRITVTNQYELKDGQSTSRYRAIKQEFYDSLGFLHTIVNLDFVSGNAINYIWNTYSNGKLAKVEEFENEKLVRMKNYSYSSNSLSMSERTFHIVGQDTLLLTVVNYMLNNKGKPVRIEAKNEKGKRLYVTTLEYDGSGLEIKRKVRAKNTTCPPDSILIRNCSPKYDSVGRLEQERVMLKRTGGSIQQLLVRYSYDDKGNLAQKNISTEAGLTIKSFRYKYNTKGKVIQEDMYDDQSKLIKSLAFRYELYAKDLKNRVIEY